MHGSVEDKPRDDTGRIQSRQYGRGRLENWEQYAQEVHPCEQYCSEMFEPRIKTGGLKGAPID